MLTSTLPALLPTYPPYPFPVVAGRGDQVFDAEGGAWWDFYGGHCVCATGHGHPAVVAAVARQAADLLFYSTAASIPVRDQAAETLLAFLNGGGSDFASVFFCNSGAEANENALKVASLLTGRTRFAAFQGGWHGRTTLALSVTDDPKITTPFEAFLAPCDRLPWGDVEAVEAFDFSATAAVILEPIQSMSGIRTASPAFFQALRRRTAEAGCLLIFDEIQTGMGRLGAPSAAAFYGVQPDLMTMAKGIASGVPMGALVMTEAVAARLKGGDLGSTFGGSPLASAALVATVQVIASEGLMARATALKARLEAALVGAVITAVQGEGLLLGLRVPDRAAALKKHLLDHHLLVGGSSDPEVLRLMPPLNLSDAAVDALVAAVATF